MIKKLKFFRKLYFLVILLSFSFLQNANANQDLELPDLPPIENTISEHTGNKEIKKSSRSLSFVQRIIKFFTFKKDLSPINKTVNNLGDDKEPFIDLGNNQLKDIKVEENDKQKLAQIPQEFQDLATLGKSTNIVQETNVSDSSKIQTNNNGLVSSTQQSSTSQLDSTAPKDSIVPNSLDTSNVSNQQAELNSSSVKSKADSEANLTLLESSKVSENLTLKHKDDINLENELDKNSSIINTSTKDSSNLPNKQTQTTSINQEIPIDKPISTELPSTQNSVENSVASLKSTDPLEVPSLLKIPSSTNIESNKPNISASLSDSGNEKINIPDISNDVTNKNTDYLPTENLQSTFKKNKTFSTPQVPSVPIGPTKTYDNEIATSVNSNKDLQSDNLSKFVTDEAKVLLLPNDDIVLGVLTFDAKLEQISFLDYSKLYETQIDQDARYKERLAIQHFLDIYDENFNRVPVLNSEEAKADAFDAIIKNDLTSLRALMDNNLLVKAHDERNDTLLHAAASSNNYYLAKFLILRGSNLSVINDEQQTPLMISEEAGNSHLTRLLKDAGAK